MIFYRWSLWIILSSYWIWRYYSFKFIKSCFINDSTSICWSYVAIELLSAFASAGSGGILPKSFLGCSGFAGFLLISCLAWIGVGLIGIFCYWRGGAYLFYWLADLMRVIFLSLLNPLAVLAGSFLDCYFLWKVGFDAKVALAFFYNDFESWGSFFTILSFEVCRGFSIFTWVGGCFSTSLGV